MPKTYLTAVDRQYAGKLREINGSLKAKKITIAQLAIHIRKDKSTLSKKLRGEVPLTLMEYLTITDILKED